MYNIFTKRLADLPYLNHTDKLIQEKYQIFTELMREQHVDVEFNAWAFPSCVAAISVKDFYLPDDV